MFQLYSYLIKNGKKFVFPEMVGHHGSEKFFSAMCFGSLMRNDRWLWSCNLCSGCKAPCLNDAGIFPNRNAVALYKCWEEKFEWS